MKVYVITRRNKDLKENRLSNLLRECKTASSYFEYKYKQTIIIIHYLHDDDDDDGYPAYSHHDKIPPWWENVSNDEGGNVSVSKNHHTPLHHDELYFEVYMYKVTHITSVSFGINF